MSKRFAIAVGKASIVNLSIFLIARAIGEDFVVTLPGQDPAALTVAMPVIATVFSSVLGWLVARLCGRFSSPRKVFTIIAVVGLVLSLGNPVAADATTAGILWLDLMHLVVFAAIVPILRASLPESRA